MIDLNLSTSGASHLSVNDTRFAERRFLLCGAPHHLKLAITIIADGHACVCFVQLGVTSSSSHHVFILVDVAPNALNSFVKWRFLYLNEVILIDDFHLSALVDDSLVIADRHVGSTIFSSSIDNRRLGLINYNYPVIE